MPILILLAGLTACNSSKDKTTSQHHCLNNLEAYQGWIGVTGFHNLVTADAHSGDHSERTDSMNEYSMTFESRLSDLSKKKIQKFNIGVWLKCLDVPGEGRYVMTVDDQGKTLKYFSFELKPGDGMPDSWVHLSGEAALPSDIPDSAFVKIYFWNTGRTPILVDDLEFSFQ